MVQLCVSPDDTRRLDIQFWWPPPGTQIDAAVCDLSGSQYVHATPGTPDLSIPAAAYGDRPAQSGLVQRHHIYPDEVGVSVSGGNHGLGSEKGVVLESVEHDGCGILCRGPGRGDHPMRQTGSIQHGAPERHRFERRARPSGQSVLSRGWQEIAPLKPV